MFLLAARVRKIYIYLAGFSLKNVTSKIELTPLNHCSVSFKEVNVKTKSAAIAFFFLLLLSFSSLFPFSGFRADFAHFRAHFALGFWSRLKTVISVQYVSKTQQDNALAYLSLYTLIFVNAPTSSNIQVSLF